MQMVRWRSWTRVGLFMVAKLRAAGGLGDKDPPTPRYSVGVLRRELSLWETSAFRAVFRLWLGFRVVRDLCPGEFWKVFTSPVVPCSNGVLAPHADSLESWSLAWPTCLLILHPQSGSPL